VRTSLRGIKALTFDVFGTVVDWRGSLIEEGKRLGRRKKIKADWAAFADAWRGGYRPAMDRVRRGELAWTNIDGLHRIILDGLLPRFGLDGLTGELDVAADGRVLRRLEWASIQGGRPQAAGLAAPLPTPGEP